MQNIFISGTTRGIGLGLARHFLKDPNNRVIMGVRDVPKAAPLFFKDPNALILKFDTTDKESRDAFAERLAADRIRLDLIINSAAVNLLNPPITNLTEKADKILNTNLLGYIDLLSPQFLERQVNNNATIVNVSSRIGDMNILRGPEIKQALLDAATIEDVERIARDYIKNREAPVPVVGKNHPWPEYAFSKLLLSIYTEVLAKHPTIVKKSIGVYSWCPGWIKTDLGGAKATGTVEQAVERFLQLLEKGSHFNLDIQGKMFSEGNFLSMRSKPVAPAAPETPKN